MHPSPRSKLALVLLTVLFSYNITALLSTAAATDAASDDGEVAAVEEAVPVEEAAPTEVEEAAPEDAAPEEAAPEEAAADDAADGTFIEPVTQRVTVFAKAKTAKTLKSKFTSGWSRGTPADKAAAPQRVAAAGDWKILLPGSTTEVNSNAPQQGVCDFDVQWDGYTPGGQTYTYQFTNQSPPFPVIQGLSGQVTTNASGFAKTSIQFNPTNLAGLTLGAQGYHVKGEESGGKQKTFWVDAGCAQHAATVKIVKSIATGSDQTKTFDFSTSTVPGWSPTGNLGHNGSYQLDVTAAGSYTVTETVPTGWDNPSIVCTGDTDGGSSGTGAVATFGVSQSNIDNDATIVCTFTNSETVVHAATVKIVKSIATGSDQTKTFDFSTSTVPGWSPTGNLGHNGSYQLDVTAAGSYTVTETVPTGWNNPSISCVDPDAGSTLGPQVGTAATFGVSQANIDNDETITCTFINSETPVIINPGTPGGTIIVDKVTLPTGASDSFAFSLTPQGGTAVPFSLTDAAAPFASNQPVGTYAVAETVPAGWDLSSATCSDGSSPAAVNLGSGEVVTCTFTNTQRGSITAVLDLVPLPGNGAARTILARFAATDFVFTGDLAATLLNDGDSIGPNEVAPATYSTTEIVPDGWDLTSIDCSDGNSSGNTGTGTATFVVDPGEDVVCTFTNVEEEVKGGVTGPGQPGAEDETPEVLARPATALPLTGSDPAGLIAIAALLILSGATSILYARQRRSS